MDLKIATLCNRLVEGYYAPLGVSFVERCTLSGSKAYGLDTTGSDYDLVGIHVMLPEECLKHPDWRRDIQVTRQRFDDNLKLVEGEPGGVASFDSFELWKLITLWMKGAFVSYELLCFQPVSQIPQSTLKNIRDLMYAGLTNRLGKAAKGVITHDWRKAKHDRKKAVMAYYRPLQALKMLQTHVFDGEAKSLLEYHPGLPFGEKLFSSYMDLSKRKVALTEKEIDEITRELVVLADELDRSVIATKFPDQVPKKILEDVLQEVVNIRSLMI